MRVFDSDLKNVLRTCILLVTTFIGHCTMSQTLTSSNLPIIIINTGGIEIPNDPKIVADMRIIYNGPGERNAVTDDESNYLGKIRIETRGSSSQQFPKKPYAFELSDHLGNDQDASLIGLPAEEDWILFAGYNDKTLMRDVLTYQLGSDLGRYAPRTRYCELVLNNNYQGIYVLMEKIKRDKNRVDIAGLNPNENSGDDITGGYIVKIDKTTGAGAPMWNSKYPAENTLGTPISFAIEYPETASPDQIQYIRNYITQFEDALKDPSYRAPDIGYSKYIDVESFVDFFLINEITKNVDGYRISTFFHKQKNSDGGKLVMGPIWDFNLGFGNANYCTDGNPEGYAVDFNQVCPEDHYQIPFWWKRLLTDPAFKLKVQERWFSYRNGKFATSRLHQVIDSMAMVLNQEATQRNFQRWPIIGEWVWPNYYWQANSYQDEVNWLKSWITDRFNWLDDRFEKIVTNVEPLNEHATLVTVVPNPTSGTAQLGFSHRIDGQIAIEIFNMQGMLVEEQSTHRNGHPQTIIIGENLQPGLYAINVMSNGRILQTTRFCKY